MCTARTILKSLISFSLAFGDSGYDLLISEHTLLVWTMGAEVAKDPNTLADDQKQIFKIMHGYKQNSSSC